LFLICAIPLYIIFGSGGEDGDTTLPQTLPEATSAPAEPIATRRPLPTAAPGSGDTWLIMLYQDADDKILEQDIFVDLNEAERVGSTGNVQIVAQLDRYQGGFSGDGNWNGTRRYYVRQDDDLNQVGSDLLEDLGEVNMASGDILVDFITWAARSYPSDHYVLILSDHGMGWPGGWSDPTATGSGGETMPLARALGDHLYLHELDDALQIAREQAGIEAFELVGMDACLMGHIEVMAALAPHARYAVLSQETEPALGWAYTAFLTDLNNNPQMTGAELGQAIVSSYIQDDQRIVDDQARAEFAGRGSAGSLFGSFETPSAQQVARQLSQNITLSALDLQVLPDLLARLNEFSVLLQEADQRYIAQARSYAQSFTNIFGKDVPASYIDLANFAELAARNSGKRNIAEASTRLVEAIGQAVLAERHGSRLPGATGISIYFPNSRLYALPAAGPESYTVASQRFAAESLWDDFLAFHYTGEGFELETGTIAAPPASGVRSPASGGITVSAVRASADTASPTQPVQLSVDIAGANLGYVKLLVGYLDTAANAIYLADSDFLASPNTLELNGVYYPDWGVTEFTLQFNWEPLVFAIDDGTTQAVALFNPEQYGASGEQAVYSVQGIYTFADSGEQRQANLYFANGALQQIIGFTGDKNAGSPREITPQPGDQFTVLDKWLDLDEQGNVVQSATQPGQTVTFGSQPLTWVELDAAAGEYIVGFLIEDLDGNSQAVYQNITVR
jgi:hypothetical protein